LFVAEVVKQHECFLFWLIFFRELRLDTKIPLMLVKVCFKDLTRARTRRRRHVGGTEEDFLPAAGHNAAGYAGLEA